MYHSVLHYFALHIVITCCITYYWGIMFDPASFSQYFVRRGWVMYCMCLLCTSCVSLCLLFRLWRLFSSVNPLLPEVSYRRSEEIFAPLHSRIEISVKSSVEMTLWNKWNLISQSCLVKFHKLLCISWPRNTVFRFYSLTQCRITMKFLQNFL